MAPAHTCEGCVLAGADERDRPVSSRQERAFALMNEDGSLSPHDRSLDRNPGSTCLPKDSFKDDIQAIGRAVERLREGFAGGSAKAKVFADEDVGCVQSRPSRASEAKARRGKGDGNARSLRGHEGEEDLAPESIRDFSTRSSGDSRDFTDDLAEDSLTLDQTRISHGQLSLDELHSRPSPRKIQAYDGARPGGGDVVRSPGDGDLSRSRRRHGGRFRPQSVVSSVSRSGVQEEIKWSGMWRDSRPDDVRSDTDFLGNDSQDLHATIGPPPPLPLPPLPMPSMAPLPIDGAGEGATKNRRELWPAKGSDTSSANDRSSKSSSRRKRRSMRRRGDSEGEPITGRGEENEGSTGSGSLYELRDALKARGKELLKLKRDVGAVATSAGSFKHLATSLANDSRGKMDSSKVAFRRDIDEGIDGRNQLGLSSASLYRDDDRPIGSEGGGVNAVVADGEVVPTVVWPEGDSARSPRKVTVEEHQHVPELFAKAVNGSASTRTEESEWPRRLKNISTSDAKKSLTTQEQSLSNPRQENALALVGGSPLVASAHAGLRKMRMVLEQRAVEAGRAKDVAGEMTDRLNDLSTRLRRSERTCDAQAAEVTKWRSEAEAARSELSRLARRRIKETKEAKEADGRDDALVQALRERDVEVTHLRDKLDTATGELAEEQGSSAALRSRLEVSERELRLSRGRVTIVEEDAAAQIARAETAASDRISGLEREIQELKVDVKSARGEANLTVDKYRALEEDKFQDHLEASRARDELKAERDRLARVHLELETSVRERTQAIEKLARAEAEAQRMRVALAAALSAADENQTVSRAHEKAEVGLQTTAKELLNVRETLASSREREETERSRFEQECKKSAALRARLEASETQRKIQEEEISFVKKQVARLDAKIEQDLSREQTDTAVALEERLAQAKREALRLHADRDKLEVDLHAAREREQQAVKDAAKLEAELVIGRDRTSKTESALMKAQEKARAAEALTELRTRELETALNSMSRASQNVERQDREMLERSLSTAEAQTAELRADNLRLRRVGFAPTTEMAYISSHGRAGAFGDAATAAATVAEVAVAEPSQAAADTGAFRTHEQLHDRLAVALAEGREAREDVERLKLKLKTVQSEQRTVSPALMTSVADIGVGTRAKSDTDRQRAMRFDQKGPLRHDAEDGSLSPRLAVAGQRVLQEVCNMMQRVAVALSTAADGTTDGPHGEIRRGESTLDDPRWSETNLRRGRRGRHERASSAENAERIRYHADRSIDTNGNYSEDTFTERSEAEDRFNSVSRQHVCDAMERLRFEAVRLLAVRREERQAGVEHIARLQQELRNSAVRETETAARLEESRELSREQTGFVEGVWQERRRLEIELGTRRDEVERMRSAEDAARTAAKLLESRVEDLSAALRQEQMRARREAEASVATEAKEAMQVLRRQLADLRREVDRTKKDHATAKSEEASLPLPTVGVEARSRVATSEEVQRSDLKELESTTETRGVKGGQRAGKTGGIAPGVHVAERAVGSCVLEGEFQRLRAKYEKAKGRIAALEELVAVSRRVSAQARKEFQGALDALKLSQKLLLEFHAQRQCADGNTRSPAAAAALSDADPAISTQQARELGSHDHVSRDSPGALQESATPGSEAEQRQAASAAEAVALTAPPLPTDDHVHELTAQASRLHGMSDNVKRLLQMAAGEVQSALEDTREAFGLAPADDGHQRDVVSGGLPVVASATAGTQTRVDVVSAQQSADAVAEDVRRMEAASHAPEIEKARLDLELEKVVGELAHTQNLLRHKTAQVLVLEAQVSRSEAERLEAREAEIAAANRLAGTELAAEADRESLDTARKELYETRSHLDTALAAQGELRGRCEELALASGAFAAEVAKQKEERARLQVRSQLAVDANASELRELRERSVKFAHGSEASAAERGRLEEELRRARAEAKEIDADVAQVLDALATSERERRRLEAQLNRQLGNKEPAQRAAEVADDTAVFARDDVNSNRAAVRAKASELFLGEMQAEASTWTSSLKTEVGRREALEKECTRLASRVSELEAALLSASAEVNVAVKGAADWMTRHERDTARLSEEAAGLRAALFDETEKTREVYKRAVEEEGEKRSREILVLKEETARETRAELEQARERAYGEGVMTEQKRLESVRQMEKGDNAELQQRLAEMADALQAETDRVGEALAREAAIRTQATREVDLLERRVVELERALDRATTAAHMAGKAARETANPMSKLQSEMRAVINSIAQDKVAQRDGHESAEESSLSWHKPRRKSNSRLPSPHPTGAETSAVAERSSDGDRSHQLWEIPPAGADIPHAATARAAEEGMNRTNDGAREREPSSISVRNERDHAEVMEALDITDSSSSSSSSKVGRVVATIQVPPPEERCATSDEASDGIMLSRSYQVGDPNGITGAAGGAPTATRSFLAQRAEATTSTSTSTDRHGGDATALGHGPRQSAKPSARLGPIWPPSTAALPLTQDVAVSCADETKHKATRIRAEEKWLLNTQSGGGSAVRGGEGQQASIRSPTTRSSSDDDDDVHDDVHDGDDDSLIGTPPQGLLPQSSTSGSGLYSSVQRRAGGRDKAGAMYSGDSGGLARKGSLVVRDWRAGQREAFSELDRKSSASRCGANSTAGKRL